MCLSWVGTFKVWHVMYTAEYISVLLCAYIPPVAPLASAPLCSSPCLQCTYSYMNRALRVHWRSHLKEKPLVHVYAIRLLHVCVRCGIWKKKKKKKRRACVLKKRRGWGRAVERQKYASVPCANKVPCACLLPGVGREMRPVREWGGWLNDFTSPFQLQQLPIYIVMQIHGLSQMVLFQHRGCIEIWLFIPSTSKVFNAPSSVCFYPLLPLATV